MMWYEAVKYSINGEGIRQDTDGKTHMVDRHGACYVQLKRGLKECKDECKGYADWKPF